MMIVGTFNFITRSATLSGRVVVPSPRQSAPASRHDAGRSWSIFSSGVLTGSSDIRNPLIDLTLAIFLLKSTVTTASPGPAALMVANDTAVKVMSGVTRWLTLLHV